MTEALVKKLQKIVGKENVSAEKDDLMHHSKDWSFHKPSLPHVVVWPKNTKQIQQILQLANKEMIPVTAWGGGSSLEGNPIPVKGGISLDMRNMNKVIKVLSDDLTVIVEPGIIGDILNEKLKKYNLFFPPAPGSSHLATVGGMIANNAGGMYAIRFGVVGDWVLQLTVVLANGDILSLGSKSYKSVSGYNVKDLLIGSEGTLGIITQATLKLAPIPKTNCALLVSFPALADASQTSLDLLHEEAKPHAIEFMDQAYIGFVNKAKNAKLPEKPTLLIELKGEKEIIFQQEKLVKKICKKNHAISYRVFQSEKELTLLWQYRRAVRPALKRILSDMGVLSAEVGIPVSKVRSFLEKAEVLSKKFRLQTVMFGHMGDGNFHGWALYELDNKKSWENVQKLNEELILFAIKIGGTTTGEHGLGIGKRKFLGVEHPTSMRLMKQIKKLLDPKGILNPGKIFVETTEDW